MVSLNTRHKSLTFKMLSRAKPALAPTTGQRESPQKGTMPHLESFISERDFLGAITLLEVISRHGIIVYLTVYHDSSTEHVVTRALKTHTG